jgi:hydroxymethylglutaryl-CoA lyase
MVDFFQLVECPRDAMQGWKTMIPPEKKIRYINNLLRVGFHTLDMGSFVSPKIIPQMADTAEVIAGIDMNFTSTRLLTIVANARGAELASEFGQVSYLGFPFSVSPTFQQRNTNSSPEESLLRVKDISSICSSSGKKLVVYMSMGFGNPYGDPYNVDILASWTEKIASLGVETISLADTVGVATPIQVSDVVSQIIPRFPGIVIGVHLHSNQHSMLDKMDAAYLAGCRRFDGAINGIGGCPMADDELVGNMDTIRMLDYFQSKGHCREINPEALEKSRKMALEIFG